MMDEWHGIPSIRRQGRQEMGKVGIVSSRYELCLSFNWCSITRVILQKQVKLVLCVLQSLSKPFLWFSRTSVVWLDTPAHFSAMCCFLLATSPLSGTTTLKKKKQWPLTRSFLHEKLSKPLSDWRTFFHLQTRKSVLYNFKSIALQLLWLYMFSMSVQGSDQKQSCHGQAPPESELRAVWQIFHVMQ